MRIDILTLFPEMFEGFKNTSIIKKAVLQNFVQLNMVDIRSFTKDKHNRVDDYPFGGGNGMVLMCQPVIDALRSVKTPDSLVILMSPQGSVFKQHIARSLVKQKHIILICGHYEGFDERILSYVDMQLSIGDYILTGGEIAAMAISDALIRLVDGVIATQSHEDESFENGLLEYPQYTRPVEYENQSVPEVLLSGHHKNIADYRMKESLRKTYLYRKDLLENVQLDKQQQQFLEQIKQETNEK